MHGVKIKPYNKMAVSFFASLVLGLLTLNAGVAHADPMLDKAVMSTLDQCQRISTSCAEMTKNPNGILIFPNVVKADIILGGAGGKGALIENGKITGYYNIGAGSVGLQIGVENASQVYVFRTPDALAALKAGPDWKVSATAGVTLVKADANAAAATGNVLAYIFDSKGLQAGISLDVFDVWESSRTRPAKM